MKLRVADLVEDSIVDGPGLRYAVFAQGCPHHCPGCHNPSTHAFEGGRLVEPEEVLRAVAANPLLSGVTLTGGEPFCQAAACARIARGAKALGLSVWAYSGYTLEALLAGAGERPEWLELLLSVDVLADGPFLLAERTLELPWRGSRNQRLVDVPASLRDGRCILYA